MDFDGFLRDCRRQWPEFDEPARLARALHPTDRRLKDVLGAIPAMATENKLMLLNRAVANLEPGEVYVEVGCYQGATLVGAALGNAGARLFGCDNFSQFDGAGEKLKANLNIWTASGQVAFHDMDYREFLARAPWRPARIGVYFYDGSHSFEDQFEGLRHALPHFSDRALVIVDDTNKRAARSANALFARIVPGFEPLLDLPTPGNHHPTWWNGVQVFRMRRNAATPEAIADPGRAFSMRKFFFDDVALNLRHRRRALRRRIKETLRGKRGRR